ncbi:MAG UNVERIFIED_CONTAM: hypothetical protein LVR18_26435 [Planctomycetaceae bacterium]
MSQSAPGWLERLYDGVEELARRYGFTVAGGDTNAWDGPFAINACLLGHRSCTRDTTLAATLVPGICCLSPARWAAV